MADKIIVKNTLAFVFPENAAQPSLADMGRFIKTLQGDRSQMDTAYKISDEKSVFIRFKSEEAMTFCLENNPTTLPFNYTDGRKVTVSVSVAGGNTRYVRIFDLPPEVTDADLSSVMEKYGPIKRVVRERFPMDIGLDMFSGVRGLYIDIHEDIPEVLLFRGRKGRIFYEGVKLKCYICKSETHLKKACAIFRSRKEEKKQQRQTGESNTATRTQQNEGEKRMNATIVADTHGQQQMNKKSCAQSDERGDNRNGRMDTAPEGSQTNANTTNNNSESESDMEQIDWQTATPEAQRAWIAKQNRKTERMTRRAIRVQQKLTQK